MITFEHELIHGLIACFCPEYDRTNVNSPGIYTGRTGPRSGHGITFMSITNNIFGHMDFLHNLLSGSIMKPTNPNWNPYKNLKPGYLVEFKLSTRAKTTLSGRVLKSGGRQTKNAIVMAENGKQYNLPYVLILSYTDLQGNEIKR